MAIITISRQFGAGGKTLGSNIAARCSYDLVDEMLIEKVAQKANVSQEWVKNVEKDAGGTLLRQLSGLNPFRRSYIHKAMVNQQGYIDGHRYVELLHEIINQIYQQGDTVIIGRGGQYILQSRPNTVHLLLMAEHGDRVRFLKENYDLDQAQANQIVTRQDKIRLNLYRYFGKQDFDNPLLYDLVLNMSRLTMTEATDLVCQLIQTRTEGSGQAESSPAVSTRLASSNPENE